MMITFDDKLCRSLHFDTIFTLGHKQVCMMINTTETCFHTSFPNLDLDILLSQRDN